MNVSRLEILASRLRHSRKRKRIAYVDEEDSGEKEETVATIIVAEQVPQPTNVYVLPLTITELLFIFQNRN